MSISEVIFKEINKEVGPVEASMKTEKPLTKQMAPAFEQVPEEAFELSQSRQTSIGHTPVDASHETRPSEISEVTMKVEAPDLLKEEKLPELPLDIDIPESLIKSINTVTPLVPEAIPEKSEVIKPLQSTLSV